MTIYMTVNTNSRASVVANMGRFALLPTTPSAFLPHSFRAPGFFNMLLNRRSSLCLELCYCAGHEAPTLQAQ